MSPSVFRYCSSGMTGPSLPDHTAEAAARSKLPAIQEPQQRVAIGHWSQVSDSIYRDNDSAMYSNEPARIQLRLESGRRLTDHVNRRTDMQRQVVALGFNPV